MKKIYPLAFFLPVLLAGWLNSSVYGQAAAQVIDTSARLVVYRSAFETGPLLKLPAQKSVAAYAAVSGAVLYQTPVANLTNTLYGRLQGLSVLQGSGEPGYDNAALSVRGIGSYDYTGLVIYVDGFQTTSAYFSYLSPAEVETVTVIKDPVTLAGFGMKGANGVLWVETKRGNVSKSRVQVQVVQGWQQAININKPYGSYDYARLYNQAVSNDNYVLNGYQFKWTPVYSDAALEAYKNGTGINVDWYKEILRKTAPYTNANIVFSGGDTATKYLLVADYMRQGGLYNVPVSATTSNAQIQRFNLRSNLDFRFFKIFEAKVDLGGRIEDRRYPNYNGPTLWANLSKYPSVIYPVKDPQTGNWSGTAIYPDNPVASLRALGWTSTHDRTLQANFNLKENLDFVTPGLYLNQAVSFNTWTRNAASKTATYARFYNGAQTTTDKSTDITSAGSSPVDQYDWKQVNLTAGYNRSFGRHEFTGAVNYFASNFVTDYGTNNPGQNTGNNIFYHYENMQARLHYTYDTRYLIELGSGWSGSDNFARGNRWAFYPAVAAGWIVSNEAFLKQQTAISFLKLRASIGWSGNDQSNNGRYLYQQYFISNGTYYTGNTSLTANGGIIQSYTANPAISAEKSRKLNLGLDATLFRKLALTIDVFQDKRSGIVTQNTNLSAVYGGIAPYANIGKVTNRGVEISLGFSDQAGPFSYSLNAMAAYTKNRIDYQAEVPPVNSFSKTTGLPIGTPMGLVADGFYAITDFNSDGTLKSGLPVPAFGAVQPGDIKYKDLDHNNRIDQQDITRIGNPDYPSLVYALNAGVHYKGFSITALFQGITGRSVNLLAAANTQTMAFVNNTNIFPIAGNAWAYYPDRGIDTRAVADYPRLTTKANDNNYRNSTFWMKNGDFLRLRNIELGYDLPAKMLKRYGMEKLRLYISAVNPFSWSYLEKHYNIDPETNAGYPGLKSYNAGFSLTF